MPSNFLFFFVMIKKPWQLHSGLRGEISSEIWQILHKVSFLIAH